MAFGQNTREPSSMQHAQATQLLGTTWRCRVAGRVGFVGCILTAGVILSSAADWLEVERVLWAQTPPLQQTNRKPDVGYHPTQPDVIEKMLEIAQVRKSDVVYDLGCGDGRIVIAAAKKYGCRAEGFEIDAKLIKQALANVRREGVEKLVNIREQDIFKLDLSRADVVTVFLLPGLNERLIPQFAKMKPGSRIISHEFDIEGLQPDKTVVFQSKDDDSEHLIYLWTTPLKQQKAAN